MNDFPREYPTFWINHVSRLLMREFEAALRPLGFGVAYLPVVRELMQGPATQRRLLDRLRVAQPTLTNLIQRMERDGIVRRTSHPTDRRAAVIELTEQARQKLPEVFAALEGVANPAIGGLSPGDLDHMVRALKAISRNLGEDPDER